MLIELDTDDIGRVDVYVDNRPFASFGVRQGVKQLEVPGEAGSVRFEGFSGDELVISNTIDLRS